MVVSLPGLGQWGRKDGFPGADGSTIAETTVGNNAKMITIYGDDGASVLKENTSGYRYVSISSYGVLIKNTSLTYSIKNPLTFIYGGTIYDWYTDNTVYQNHVSWSPDKKSQYDPCPRGWRIGKDGTWNDYTTQSSPYHIQGVVNSSGNYYQTNGLLYNHISWYPSTGYIGQASGVLTNSGNLGFSWSSTTNDIHALDLNFGIGRFNHSKPDSRACGMPARCIQE